MEGSVELERVDSRGIGNGGVIRNKPLSWIRLKTLRIRTHNWWTDLGQTPPCWVGMMVYRTSLNQVSVEGAADQLTGQPGCL